MRICGVWITVVVRYIIIRYRYNNNSSTFLIHAHGLKFIAAAKQLFGFAKLLCTTAHRFWRQALLNHGPIITLLPCSGVTYWCSSHARDTVIYNIHRLFAVTAPTSLQTYITHWKKLVTPRRAATPIPFCTRRRRSAKMASACTPVCFQIFSPSTRVIARFDC